MDCGLYVGAGMGDDSGYGARVLQEKDRLAQAARGIVVRPRIEPIPATASKPSHDAPRIDEKIEPKLDARRSPLDHPSDAGSVASL